MKRSIFLKHRIGSCIEHVTGDDPDKRDCLMKGLDVFVDP